MQDATKHKIVPALLPNMRIDRFLILSLLGAGGMGQVYLARDERLGREVAIKLLPVQSVQDENRFRRFEQEARAASALNHPNIVTVYEVGECEAGRFIVMELVQGRTLRELIGEGLSLEDMLELAVQMAKALAVAHKAGIVHRDIKPENIMVREDRYVKVLDFGLARLAASDALSSATVSHPETAVGTVSGTMRYMSPEQARGEVLDGSSDIFSLGIVFYEMATGLHPFKAASPLATFHALVTENPLPVSRFKPETPEVLEELILSMLEKDSRFRPAVEEVETRLSSLRGMGPASATPVKALLPSPRKAVGRKREREQLRNAFMSALAGRGSLVCVAGEAGLGKTTLIESFLSDLTERREPYMIGRGRSSERLAGTEAFLPLLEALDSLLHGDPTGRVARLMKLVAPTWYSQLVTEYDSRSDRPVESRAVSPERMKRELSSIVQELARGTPLIIFFDDLQWADVSTIDMIAYLANKFEGLRLLIVVAYRQSELLLAKHPFLAIKPDLQSRGVCQEITLGFLTAKEVEEYLTLSFPQNRFPLLAASIYSRTEGNPLFMADLVRYLRDQNVIAQEEGVWVLTQTLPETERNLPESVRGMIQRKIDYLTEKDRQVLTTASVQGYDFDSPVLSAVLEMKPEEVEEELEKFERVHALVRLVGEKEMPNGTLSSHYQFVHILYQNAFYDSLRPTRKRVLSAVIAQSLLGFYGQRSSEIAHQLVALFETARDFTHAVEYCLLAVQNSAKLFAHREAAILARRGLELLKPLAATSGWDKYEFLLQLALGRSLCLTVGYTDPEPVACFARARKLSQALGEQIQVFPAIWGLWMYYIVGADCQKARELAEQLLRMAESSADPYMIGAAQHANALSLELVGDLVGAKEHSERAISFDDPKRHLTYVSNYLVDPTISAHGIHIRVLWLLGYPDQSAQHVRQLLARINEQKLDPRSICDCLISMSCYHQFCNQEADVQNLTNRVTEICEEYGMQEEGEWGRFLGDWARSQQGAREAIEGMRSRLQSLMHAHAYMFVGTYYTAILAQALAKIGEIEEGLDWVSQGLEFANRTGHRYFESELHRLRGELLETGAGGAEAAEECFRSALHVARNQQARSLELRAAMSLSRFLRKYGKGAEARELLSTTYGWFTEGFETSDLREAKALLGELQ
jgi:serine/threonine protein kinase/tetratricopeptide (TPR) repeat protein